LTASARGIEAVLFDFDHTLGVDHRLEETVLRSLSERYCEVPFTDERIVASLALFRQGTLPLSQMLRGAFEECACGDEIEGIYKSLALDLLPARLELMAGASMTVSSLTDRGLKLAILSNGWTQLQMAKAVLLGFRGSVFVSESIGAWKPDARAFEIATQGLDVSPERSIYVGDSPLTDVVGAKSAGMISVWADLEGQSYPDGAIEPDYSITALDQLIGLVES
jgi:HAD superfamily hydrolase (TIGR01509 family)